MTDLNFNEQAEALRLASDSLKYAWTTTEDDERADAVEMDRVQEFEWFKSGYLAAAEELDALAVLLDEHARGVLKVNNVNGL